MQSIPNSVVSGQWRVSFGKKFIFEFCGPDSKQKAWKPVWVDSSPRSILENVRSYISQFLILSDEIFSLSLVPKWCPIPTTLLPSPSIPSPRLLCIKCLNEWHYLTHVFVYLFSSSLLLKCNLLESRAFFVSFVVISPKSGTVSGQGMNSLDYLLNE